MKEGTSFSKISLLSLLLVLVILLAANAVATPAAALAKPGCTHNCGKLTIPYPFGTSEACYLNPFFYVTCNESSNQLFLGNGNLRVLNISLDAHELRISSWVAADCYDQSGGLIRRNDPWLILSWFPISHTKNMFIVIGCDSYAYVRGSLGVKYSTGCMSLCDTIQDVVNGSCSGIGCCQTSIPEGVIDFNLSARSFQNHGNITDFNPCSFAFVVENGMYNFSIPDLVSLSNIETMPVVVDWAIGNESCEEAKNNMTTYACGKNRRCYEPDEVSGYRSSCSQSSIS